MLAAASLLGDFFFLAEHFRLPGVDFVLGVARLGGGSCIVVVAGWGGAVGWLGGGVFSVEACFRLRRGQWL